MSNVVQIYCDGGCRNNGRKNNIGGWGAVLMFKDKVKEIKGSKINTTNNQMELTACIEALKLVKTGFDIECYCDSAYIVNCMNDKWYRKWQMNGWKTSKKQSVENKDLWIELLELINSHSIKFFKIKGHTGVIFNERADELANEAMDELTRKEDNNESN